MSNFLRVHADEVARPVGALGSPVPPFGSTGSLRLYSSAPLQYLKGDKVVVTTGGLRYEYYSTVDLLTGYGASYSLPVDPNIQAAHSVADVVDFPYTRMHEDKGMNAIVSVNCCGAGPSTGADTLRFPVAAVIDWPWSVDPYGLSWDSANLLALIVRPLSSAMDYLDTTVGQSWLTPVPRSIAAYYTQFSQRTLGPAGGYYARSANSYDRPMLTAYRDANSVRDRSTMPLLRREWRPKPQKFTFVTADTSGSGGASSYGSDAEMTSSPNAVSITTDDVSEAPGYAYAVGCRGGRYSFCGIGNIFGSGSGVGFTVQIRAVMPGLGDILIHSVHVDAGINWFDPGPVVTGTWAGVVVPTDNSGTCARFYLRAIPDIADPTFACSLSSDANVVIAATTQVPYFYHVVYGNLHAPGGLIAPFY